MDFDTVQSGAFLMSWQTRCRATPMVTVMKQVVIQLLFLVRHLLLIGGWVGG